MYPYKALVQGLYTDTSLNLQFQLFSKPSQLLNKLDNTMIASVSFVLTGGLICNFPQTGEIYNFSL